MLFQHSQDQSDAIDSICDILIGTPADKSGVAVLTGSAGTGKTTVLDEIINRIIRCAPLLPICLAATTHRAASVLQQIVNRPVTTGHSLFKLRPSISARGNETLISTGPLTVPFGAIVIIDEASMIGNKFLKAIVDIVQKRALKVLFVGDPFQLAPPKDKCSIFDGSLPTFKLTQIHRQAGGNPILEKANEFREYIQGLRQEMPILGTELNWLGEGIHILSHGDFVTKFVDKYMDYSAGADVDMPLCTYTNESAIGYNSMIRKAAYFLEGTIQPFYPQEQLISNSSVMQGDQPLLTNNEIVYVKSYEAGKLEEIPGYYVTVKGSFGLRTGRDTKVVFVPQNKAAADKILDVYKLNAKQGESRGWLKYYNLKNQLADLRPPFAGTTHKAQGGTFPAVFIDKTNIDKCHLASIKARLMYVALTRATTHVYINS